MKIRQSINAAFRSLQRMVRRICAPKPKRLELKLATYSEAEGLLRAGWTLAPEEDHNRAFGLVYLERLDSSNTLHAATIAGSLPRIGIARIGSDYGRNQAVGPCNISQPNPAP